VAQEAVVEVVQEVVVAVVQEEVVEVGIEAVKLYLRRLCDSAVKILPQSRGGAKQAQRKNTFT
jgi:hypothetical protein